jgi:hypothetical protein
MAGVSTWRYVDRVVEISHATPKQKMETSLNPKSNAVLKRTCGVP